MDDIRAQMRRQAAALARQREQQIAKARRREEAQQQAQAAALEAIKARGRDRRPRYEEMTRVFLEAMQRSGRFGRRTRFTDRWVWDVTLWRIGHWEWSQDHDWKLSQHPYRYFLGVDGELYRDVYLDERGRPMAHLGSGGQGGQRVTDYVLGYDNAGYPTLAELQSWLAETLARYGITP